MVAHSSVGANMRMWKGAHKELMALVLDDLLNDGRLARLFSKDARHCALQLWVLQIKSGQAIENRIVYGRLLPYNHSGDRWYSPDDDNFRTFSTGDRNMRKPGLNK